MQQERKEATQREGCVQVEGSRQEVVTVDEVNDSWGVTVPSSKALLQQAIVPEEPR